ncbi:MAG: protein kinase domain-containing protein, partial [Candidatus Rokuibacteriota bacterium]
MMAQDGAEDANRIGRAAGPWERGHLTMVEKIGKYRILERVGRGGMGTVFKAQDPVLSRLVALKVISGEVDVTDELKARFFREARACAKLNHPNIIIVYDLGEDADRLFIVMELLEGEELKRLIGERKHLPLEEKLSLMIQVCDGLHYAHERGVVHRDIKPGNIFVQRNGQVKILDFGIARIAATDTGLTRTGFIMGTLRYMSPEQARGRVDHRSDIFSVGTVFYELLAYRPAFDRENPIEILEQLRSENPPPLVEVDPSLPPALAAIIERALRKDPAERFPDLGQMRAELELVRRRLTEEAEQLRVQVLDQLAEIRALHGALGERLGESLDESTLPVVEDDAPFSALRACQEDFARRLLPLRARVEDANAVEPFLTRALGLLREGDPEAASREFERVLQKMPEHPRAVEGLSTALREAERRRRPVEEVAVPVERGTEVAGPAVLGARHADGDQPRVPAPSPGSAPRRLVPPTRRVGRREAAVALVVLATIVGGVTWAIRSTRTPVADPAPSPAPAQEVTSTPTPPSPPIPQPPSVTSVVPREEAEQGRTTMLAAREAAAQAGAERLVSALWGPATEKASEAETAFAAQDYARAQAAYQEARQAYEQAGGAARGTAEVRRAQEQVAEARRAAAVVEAQKLATSLWTRASGVERQAEDAVRRQEFDRAQALLRDAVKGYREAAGEAARKAAAASSAERERVAAQKRDLAAAEESAAATATARREAELAGAPRYASKTLALAQEKEKEGQVSLGRGEYAAARERLREAQNEYQRARHEAAEAEKRETLLQGQLQRDTEQVKTQMAQARGLAEQAEARRVAPRLWAEATAKETEGQAALGRREFAAAQQRFREAQQGYQRATQEAHREAATQAQRQRETEQLRDQAAQARRVAEGADAKRLAPRLWAEAAAKETDGQGALGRR